MGALFYVTKRSFINHFKQALRKPLTLILMILGVLYGVFVIAAIGIGIVNMKIDSIMTLVVIVTIWTLYIFLSNFMSYAGKKGVIFRPSHSHFIFTAPIRPKMILVYGAWMNYLLSIVVNLLFTLGGIFVFQVEPLKMLVFFLIGTVCEVALEGSLMVFLYTNERLPKKLMKVIINGIKVLLAAITLLFILYFKKNGLSLESAVALIDNPVLQMLPVVGWNIAAYRLILLGPTTLNIIGTVLYLLTVGGMLLIACKMQCNGEYYEDAAKFADDYAEAKKRSKAGDMTGGIGKKRKFRAASGTFTASGAKAIFYRQLLEYKKERYFIFDKMTLILLVLAIVFSQTMGSPKGSSVNELWMLGIIAYVSIIMSGYLGKWEKELKNPYIYLIPDTAIRKMWYATLMEHVKSFVDGCVLCIPFGIVWHLPPVNIVLAILIYTVLSANKLYTKVIAQCLVGEVFGKSGVNMIRLLMQTAVIGVGALIAVGVGFLIHFDLVFPIILIYSMIVTVVIGLLASIRFGTMEQLG